MVAVILEGKDDVQVIATDGVVDVELRGAIADVAGCLLASHPIASPAELLNQPGAEAAENPVLGKHLESPLLFRREALVPVDHRPSERLGLAD